MLGLTHDVVDLEMTISHGDDALFRAEASEAPAGAGRFGTEASSTTDLMTLVGYFSIFKF